MLSRRSFLQTSTIVSLSPLVPGVLCRAARAASAQPDARSLVVIQLDGGNDGLNTVIPYADDAYAKLRPKLRIERERVHKLNDHVGLHPQMSAAKELFDDGRLAIIQNVGYPNPIRSHFRSMRIWQTASFDDTAHDGYGWLGRSMDERHAAAAGASGGSDAADAPLVYIGDGETPVSLWARRASSTSLERLDDLTLQRPLPPGHDVERVDAAREIRQFVTRNVLSAYASAEQLAAKRRAAKTPAAAKYPDSKLASRLSVISQLLQSGSQARVFYAVQDGYDTHAAQEFTHAQLLAEFSGALKAFLDDLETAGLHERVTVLAFSEFGRRAAENESRGTDHGAAGPVFLAGASVQADVLGAAPDLANLADGDVRMEYDFRRIYATLLEGWLDVSASSVLGETFDSLPLFSRIRS
jgi:uncharacterized protein (DUF1501 family)